MGRLARGILVAALLVVNGPGYADGTVPPLQTDTSNDLYARLGSSKVVLGTVAGGVFSVGGPLDAAKVTAHLPGVMTTLQQTLAAISQQGFSGLYGTVGDNSTDNTATLNSMISSALSGPASNNGGVVELPCGYYKISGSITANIPAGQRLAFKGSGFCTVLAFQGTGGFVANYLGPYSGFLFADMILTTNQAGGATGISLNQTATNFNPALAGQTTIRDVALVGADFGTASPADYWGTGINQRGVSDVNIDNPIYLGANTSGVGIAVSGLSAASPAVLTNVKNPIMYGCATGILYGRFYQGLSVTNPEMTSCNYGVQVSSAITAGDHDAMLSIVGGQMANLTANVACSNVNLQNEIVLGVYMIMQHNAEGIQVCGTGAKIADNEIISPNPSGSAIGIHVTAIAGIPAHIHGNAIGYLNEGIFFDPGNTTPTVGSPIAFVEGNMVFGTISGGYDYSVNAADSGIVIDDFSGRPYASLPPCNQSIRGSKFLITDSLSSPLPAYLGATSGGGSLLLTTYCTGGSYANE